MTDKLKSRKFFVFLVWLLIGGYMVFTQQDLSIFIPNFMIISAIYIGGNTLQKYIYKDKE